MSRSIRKRRDERELFFWTVERGLRLVILAAFAYYVVASVLEGHAPGSELVQFTVRAYWPG